ncbi:DUF4349 domain-containing protein [Glaciihabitans sp. dw_435]|uniref:DUF4349 domain-containing protein n=1 Tax=Glaciihabitans sp. dw_435 TaxID=2720081 RepID=UPI001BD66FC5|nr:DUF4349 domain-containing protein [Glaciihabitans sp. dw_435]
MRRRFLGISAVALVAALCLAGCTARGGSDSASTQGDGSPVGSSQGTSSQGDGPVATEPDSAADASAPGSSSSVTSAADRQIVTTGTVNLTATAPTDAATRAIAIVEDAGGRVDSRSETSPVDGDAGSATLTLRIPAASLTPTLERIKKLGTVDSIAIKAADVTTQSNDLNARITALQASVDRLLVLLAKSSDTKVLIELETAISSRQGELDSLTAQRRQLTDQVAMSTVTLLIGSPADAPVKTPDSFWSSVVAGLTGFAGFFTGVLFVLGYLLPWIVLAGVIAVVVVLVLRRRRGAGSSAPASTPH